VRVPRNVTSARHLHEPELRIAPGVEGRTGLHPVDIRGCNDESIDLNADAKLTQAEFDDYLMGDEEEEAE
jgi:hypothetical protein